MKPSWTFTRGFLLGAGLMYLMDPSQGRRRRGLVRDRVVRAWMGAVAVAYGARKAIDRAQSEEDEGRVTPNYAYLR